MEASVSRMRKLRAALLAVVFAVAASLALGVSQPAFAADSGTWMRLAGSAAPDTMQAIVEEGWSSPKTVVLTTNADYPDALAASSVAGMAKAPVIMTNPTALNDQAKALLAKLKPTKIIAIGGTSALNDATLKAAAEATGVETTTVRLAGENRYETADDILNKAAAETGGTWSDTAFVSRGDNFKDALSASSIAYANSMPIVLANRQAGSVSDDSLAAMKAAGIKNVYILGGTEAVPESVAQQLKTAGYTVDRVGGADGVKTSNLIAKLGVEKFGMSADYMAVATVDKFSDALAGGAFCGLNKSVLVLVNNPDSAGITDFITKNASEISTSYIFGGTAAVSETTEAALKKAAPGATVTISFEVPGVELSAADKAKLADQTIPYDVMVRDVASYGSNFAYPVLENAAGESIYWYTDTTYSEKAACGPKSSWITSTTLYGKFHPYFTVTIQDADGKDLATKSYTKAEFAALADNSGISATNPASCLWNYNSSSKASSVSTAISYVTVEQLVKDAAADDKNALAVWDNAYSEFTYAAADASATRTVGDLKNGKFFGSDDAASGVKVAAGFGLNWKSGATTSDKTAADVQSSLAAELAKEAAGASQAPRMMFGITDAEFAAKSYPRGMQMLSNIMSITVKAPAPVTVSFVVPDGVEKPADQTIPCGVMVRDVKNYGSTFAYPVIENEASESIYWYTDETYSEKAACGPKSSWASDTTLYGRFMPYFTVTIQSADGKDLVSESYTKAEFAKLAETSGINASNPASCLWNYNSSSKTSSVSTAISYVTVEQLVNDAIGKTSDKAAADAADAIWDTDSATLTYAAADASATRTVGDLKSGKFFKSDDAASGVAVSAGFGLNWASDATTSDKTAEAIQSALATALAKEAAGASQAPRMMFGITDAEFAAKSYPRGMQMLSNILSITIVAPTASASAASSSDLVPATI